MKKIISILVITCMLALTSTASFTALSTSEAENAIDLIDKQNFVGTTSKEKVKNYINHLLFHSKFAAFSSGKFNYPNSHNDWFYSVSDGTYTENIYGSKGCMAYCYFVSELVYNDGAEKQKQYYKKTGDVTSSGLKEFIENEAQAGEQLRVSGKHSVTYISCDNNGFYYMDYNGDDYRKIRFLYRSYNEFIEKYQNHLKSWKSIWIYNANTNTNNTIVTIEQDVDEYCTHSSYNNYGKCKNCGEEYPMSVSPMSATTYQAVKDDVPVRNRPYSPEKIIKNLSKGSKVTVVASGKNSAGNLWYKLNDETWVYSKNLEKYVEKAPTSTLSINVTQYPTSITKGSSFGLRGDISSNYNISSIKGYVINSSGSTVMSTSDYPDKKSVNIRYINLNEDMYFGDLSSGKYTLHVVVKDDSGKKITWERSFEVKSETKQETSCSHSSYDSYGKCKKCGKEYTMNVKTISATTYQTVKNDVPVRNRPYSPENIIKYLSKGTKVTVVASAKNSVGNLWYKLSDGTWIYSGNLEKASTAPAQAQTNTSSTSIRFELESVPKGNLQYGKSFPLKGWFRSDSAIVEARAYMLDSNKNIIMEEKASSTTNNYKIQGYKLDKAMKFSKLSPGAYFLKFYVKDANGDTATWISEKFYIVK